MFGMFLLCPMNSICMTLGVQWKSCFNLLSFRMVCFRARVIGTGMKPGALTNPRILLRYFVGALEFLGTLFENLTNQSSRAPNSLFLINLEYNTSQWLPKIANKPPGDRTEAWSIYSLTTLRGYQPGWHLDLEPQDDPFVRGSHLCVAVCHGSPRERVHPRTSLDRDGWWPFTASRLSVNRLSKC